MNKMKLNIIGFEGNNDHFNIRQINIDNYLARDNGVHLGCPPNCTESGFNAVTTQILHYLQPDLYIGLMA